MADGNAGTRTALDQPTPSAQSDSSTIAVPRQPDDDGDGSKPPTSSTFLDTGNKM